MHLLFCKWKVLLPPSLLSPCNCSDESLLCPTLVAGREGWHESSDPLLAAFSLLLPLTLEMYTET